MYQNPSTPNKTSKPPKEALVLANHLFPSNPGLETHRQRMQRIYVSEDCLLYPLIDLFSWSWQMEWSDYSFVIILTAQTEKTE